jgi:hypothetical protein
MKKILLLALMAAASCAGEEAFQGQYACGDCTFQTITFQPDGKVKLQAMELTLELPYAKEGNTITIEAETASYVFELQDNGWLQGQGDVEGLYTKQ